MFTYLLINLATVFIPLALSFESRIRYFKKWKYVAASTAIVGFFFIVWDSFFTQWGVWGFSPAYLIGITFFHLPLEEILFFFCVPFSCIFIYELVCHFDRDVILKSLARPLTIGLAVVLLILGFVFLHKVYTSITFLLLAWLLVIHFFLLKKEYIAHFYLAYAISVIPFLLVNGVLTNGIGFISKNPVVWYNNAQNLGLRLMGIPLEDFFYSLLLLLSNITIYEYFKGREYKA